ncbi:MAG: 30S ribosomal protein S17 [Hydrocarboniphaga effusa]|nr:30S ribosomal protein S17 [Hydrocarboniphaga effusa]
MTEQNQSTAAAPHVVSGRVVSNKMKKTIVVSVEREVVHPLYGKRLRRSTKLHAHDEQGECRIGDLVSIQECRRLSATKHWKLLKVLEKAPAAVAEAAV